jgi:hypothetical protein
MYYGYIYIYVYLVLGTLVDSSDKVAEGQSIEYLRTDISKCVHRSKEI